MFIMVSVVTRNKCSDAIGNVISLILTVCYIVHNSINGDQE